MKRLLIILVGATLITGCSHSVPPPTTTPAAGTTTTTTLQIQTTQSPPSASAFPQKWTTLQVLQAFQAAGLPAKSYLMHHKDYGVGPMTADEGRHFLIPSLGPDNGGRVFTFSSQADLDTMKQWYVKWGKSSAALYSYVYTRDNILVQINGELDEAKAAKYHTVLMQMK